MSLEVAVQRWANDLVDDLVNCCEGQVELVQKHTEHIGQEPEHNLHAATAIDTLGVADLGEELPERVIEAPGMAYRKIQTAFATDRVRPLRAPQPPFRWCARLGRVRLPPRHLPPSPATASAEGAQLNGRPSPGCRRANGWCQYRFHCVTGLHHPVT